MKKEAFTFSYRTDKVNHDQWIVVIAIDRKTAIARLIEYLKDQREEEILNLQLRTTNQMIGLNPS